MGEHVVVRGRRDVQQQQQRNDDSSPLLHGLGALVSERCHVFSAEIQAWYTSCIQQLHRHHLRSRWLTIS